MRMNMKIYWAQAHELETLATIEIFIDIRTKLRKYKEYLQLLL